MKPTDYGKLWLFRKDLLAGMFGSWMVWNAWDLVRGLIEREVFDALTGDARVLDLGPYALILLLLVANVLNSVGACVWLGQNFRWFNYLNALLYDNLLGGILRRNPTGDLPTSPGDAVNRFRADVPGTTDVLNEWYRLPGHALFSVGALVIMYRIDPMVTVVSVVPLAGVVVVVHTLNARLERYATEMRERTGAVTSFIGETLGAVQAVKVATAEDRVVEAFRSRNGARHRAVIRYTFIDQLIRFFSGNVSNFGRALILVLAARSMRSGAFTVGDFMLFTSYLGNMLEFPRRVGRLLAARRVADVASRRLETLVPSSDSKELVRHRSFSLSQRREETWTPIVLERERLDTLRVEGLSFGRNANGSGIHDVTLEVGRGELFIVTGKVGAGKSTFLKVLTGLLPSTSGHVLWNGDAVEDLRSFMTPPHCAFVPQVPCLFSETLRENVVMGMVEEPGQLRESIVLSELSVDVPSLDDGLDTVVGPRGVRLSGGQVQRVAAARAFYRDAALLVFDDLSSALDVETELRLWEHVARLRASGTACIAVSHSRTAWRQADKIVVFRDGRVVALGRLEDLMVSSEDMQVLWSRDE